MTYLFKVTLCSGLLIFVYKLLFEKQKMHFFNRFYLLSSLVLSFVFPVITYGTSDAVIPIEGDVYFNNQIATDIGSLHAPGTRLTLHHFLAVTIIIYLTVTALLLIKYLTNIKTLLANINSNTKVPYKNQKIVLLREAAAPHSFWNCIFVNGADYLEGKIEDEILAHELSHVQQKHSLDILVIEFFQAVFWFNPFVYLYKKAIQLNHEFLADEAVIKEFKDTYNYQCVLLKQVSKQASPAITSASNYLITKRRMIMMTKHISYLQSLWRQVTVIPVIAILVFLFGTRLSAQTIRNDLDTAFRRMLERNLPFPESIYTGKDGIILLHVSKSNGSIIIKSIYSSYKDYDPATDANLSEIANQSNGHLMLNQSELIVPVIYNYLDDMRRELNLSITPEAKQAINEIGRDIDVNTPVIMIAGRKQ